MADEKTIAFVLYPGCTILDLVGPLQVLSMFSAMRPEFRVTVVAEELAICDTDTPLHVRADRTFADVPAPDVVVVPGGGTPTLRAAIHEPLLAYLRGVAPGADLVASVCTGSLILGAAGLLEGRRATTHWAVLDVLAEFGATPVGERWVQDGPVLTAAGVSAGIDMALHLVEELAGAEVARTVQFGIEYDPEPPHGGLEWSEAPRALYATVAEQWLQEGLGTHPLAERLAARLNGSAG
ncbi:DJ-1/PfpI family protein [Saccharopolyspora antimicrobica]|uniref:DJ-1/PfpI family protein n=1 Tax=Saccharopolyspora antimicrobica TaxID=455193 RepID=A0A1I4RYM8_9PSEU|nr:DJ-1/PfpI family protein [Saccharopolyspora antimicrobica]RKT89197.1 DJ-1/PfpI family protein [Saccharopolyspora antimicrobica]SFM57317.1 DJ-1/PfpI family protein [Saccharopolyspora antimicrobica]